MCFLYERQMKGILPEKAALENHRYARRLDISKRFQVELITYDKELNFLLAQDLGYSRNFVISTISAK